MIERTDPDARGWRAQEMTFNRVSFHLWPPVWAVEALVDISTDERDFDVSKLIDQVFSHRLNCGITIEVQRQGIFTFDFSHWAPARGGFKAPSSAPLAEHYSRLRSDVLNSFLACLYTAGDTLQPADNDHPLSAWSKMWVTAQDLMLSQTNSRSQTLHPDTRTAAFTEAHWRSTYTGSPRDDWRHIGRIRTVQERTLRMAADLLSQIIDAPDSHLASLVSLYNQACVTYEAESYGPALVMAWAIIEHLLNRLWVRYLQANRTRSIGGCEVQFISNKRMNDRLLSSDYTASVRAEICSLVDILPFDLYNATLPIRAARNKWMHDLAPVSAESARVGIETAERMLELVEQVKLHSRLVTFPWA